MATYERRCRVLLRALPADYRSERGEEIVAVLLDTSEPGQRWPSLRTAVDLLQAGLRARGHLATEGRASSAVIEGMRVAALVGLCVQAAFSVAMVSHYARDGMLFYEPTVAWSTAAIGVLAGIWVVAFIVLLAGWARLAVAPALVGSAGSVILLVSSIHGAPTLPSVVLIAVEMTLLGLVPTLALVAASTRPSPTPGPRSLLWLVALAGLTAVFSGLGTGVRTNPGGGHQLSFPPSGGLVGFLVWACLAALVVMFAASTYDPRLGVAIVVASLPVVVYQIGLLVTVQAKPTEPVVVAIAAFAATTVVAISSTISLRRLRA